MLVTNLFFSHLGKVNVNNPQDKGLDYVCSSPSQKVIIQIHGW